MPESRPPIELQGLSLAELQKLIDERRLPPVDKWNPDRCGHSGMRIARDGTWYHEGSRIRRPAMVRLFSTVLRREADGSHVLVTPVEKLDIDVESTAFRAVEMSVEAERRAYDFDGYRPRSRRAGPRRSVRGRASRCIRRRHRRGRLAGHARYVGEGCAGSGKISGAQ